jgi:hypothetical protein
MNFFVRKKNRGGPCPRVVDHHSGQSMMDMRRGTVAHSSELVLAGDSGHRASSRDDLAVEGDAGASPQRQTVVGWRGTAERRRTMAVAEGDQRRNGWSTEGVR